jgi:hypothetical protein
MGLTHVASGAIIFAATLSTGVAAQVPAGGRVPPSLDPAGTPNPVVNPLLPTGVTPDIIPQSLSLAIQSKLSRQVLASYEGT